MMLMQSITTLPTMESSMQKMKNKTVIVTGGAGGIGSATCRRFAADGAKVAVFDMNLEAANQVAQDIQAAGGQAAAFKCDITDRAAVDAAVAAAIAQLGPIDVLVNNAGWDVFKPFVKTVPDEWSKLIAINLTGALHMLHAVLPGMVERNAGRVVNVASDAARGGSSGEAVYSACKGGLVSLSKTLAREHARHNITFNVVCPGPTDTALLADVVGGARDPAKLVEAFRSAIPLGRLGQPDDLANAIAFFGSDDASFITGQVISVSGGLTMHG
jgi:2-hydroxycyclohexanecarboxyl-CoA dehydrogenase